MVIQPLKQKAMLTSLSILFLTAIVIPTINLVDAQNSSSSSSSSNQLITIPNNDSNSTNIVSSNGTITLSNNSIPLHKENVVYYKNTSGYLVYPENTSAQGNETGSKLPGLVVIHEWWGLNDHIKNMADELAKEGYVVLAVDLYNGEVAASPDQAMSLVNAARDNQNESNSNMLAAVDYMKSLPNVDPSKIASVGWCFGGGQALQLALNTPAENPMAATVLYYGNLVTDSQQLAKIKGPVLGVFGSEDQAVPVSEVRDFEAALNANNITNNIYIYEGVGHAFANPTGESFAPGELKDAWQKTIEFLDSNLKNN